MSAGAAVYLTGPPASGKTTIARALCGYLRGQRRPILWLDSDELRRSLAPDLGYDERDRERFYRLIADRAVEGAKKGALVIISATAHQRRFRDWVRERVPHFLEVEVNCPLALAKARDPKGLYRAAADGHIRQLPSADVAYEAPLRPELVLHSDEDSAENCALAVLQAIADLDHGSGKEG